MIDFRIYPDGSFDLSAKSVCLKGAYPAVDGLALRPLSVEASARHVRYALLGGALEIAIEAEDDALAVHCRVWGLACAHDIDPIAHARIEGAQRAFRQGLGIGGPSGFVTLDGKARVESDGVLAVGRAGGACLALWAREQGEMRNRYAIDGGLLCAAFDTEGAALAADEGLSAGVALPTIYLREGVDFASALRACAREIAEVMGARPVKAPAFHWCSWYYLYHTLDQATLETYLAGFKAHREDAPFSHIQIDAGYFPSCGDWLETNERFPGGLKAAAEAIRQAGYEPGIWIGPYMVGEESRLFREHPDWMLKNAEGGLVTPWIQYNEPKPWGYRDSEYYVLDTSCPQAMAYLRRVFETLRAWGFTLFKTDFLLWGLQDASKVKRYAPGKTSFAYFRDTMRMIREAIGEDARWLGCIAPFMPSLGFVDMMRIGGDVGAQWNETGFGPTNMIRELVADQYFQFVYWQNDPDAVMLRDFHIHLEREQIEALALLQAVSGGAIYTSDPIHLMGEERLRLLRLIRPHGLAQTEYPFWSEQREEIFALNRLPQGAVALLFNPTNQPLTRAYDWRALLGEKVNYLWQLHAGSARVEDVPCVTIPPRACLLYFASETPLDGEPENLWIWGSRA